MSDGMKRSMTVIQEEDFEESAQATSYLNFNSYLGGNNLINSSPRSRAKFNQHQQAMLQQSNQSMSRSG